MPVSKSFVLREHMFVPLANDIGDKLGCGGCLSKLRRESSDPFTIDKAHSLDFILSKTRDTLQEISISTEEIST